MNNITNKETIDLADFKQLIDEGHDISEIVDSYPEAEDIFFFQFSLYDL